ncbi:WhiB family transcriptional regulator [Streptomyces sp. NPDC006654]|uniref:WhiB family transcriptional regulator n=1 Tax=Streptomyces sp. NPDC006654 TaxID=3156897 RepID=UPI0033D42853
MTSTLSILGELGACATSKFGEREEDPELFFPIGNTGPALIQIEEAKSVCHRCPVMDQCLQWALEFGQTDGVWGGLSEAERRAMKRRAARNRARQTGA